MMRRDGSRQLLDYELSSVSSTVTSSVATEPWGETTLGELAEYITSGSRDWSRYYADSGAIFIRTQDINQNRLSLKEVAFVKLPEKVEGKRSLIRKGDLLITITGANVGKVAVVEGEVPEAYVSQSVCLVRLKDPALAKFVHLQLTAKRGDKTTVEAMAYGLGRPVLNLENIRSAPIRVAPAIAQVVIVAEIEKQFSRLDEAVANLKRVKANLKRYKASVLKATVEGKLTEEWRKQHPNVEPAGKFLESILAERRAKWNGRGKYKETPVPDSTTLPPLPKTWTWSSVETVCSAVVDCPHSTPKWQASGRVCLRTTEFRPGRLDLSDVRYVSQATYESRIQRLTPRENDIVYSREGGILGLACMIPARLNPCLGQRMMLLRSHALFSPNLLMYWLNSPDLLARVRSLTGGSASPHLNVGEVKSFPVPVAPIAEQNAIAAEVERRLSVIDELEAAVQASLTRADRLRQSTLQKAFSGKLVLNGAPT